MLSPIPTDIATVDSHVYYGTAVTHGKDLPWDYIVFSRDTLNRKANRAGYAFVINVAIVREEYIPEGLEDDVVAAMEALPGVRMVEGTHEYYYRVKPNTKHTVEMVVLHFTVSRKL